MYNKDFSFSLCKEMAVVPHVAKLTTLSVELTNLEVFAPARINHSWTICLCPATIDGIVWNWIAFLDLLPHVPAVHHQDFAVLGGIPRMHPDVVHLTGFRVELAHAIGVSANINLAVAFSGSCQNCSS